MKGMNTSDSKSPNIKKTFQISAKNSPGGGIFSSFNRIVPEFASPIDFKQRDTESDEKIFNQALEWNNTDMTKFVGVENSFSDTIKNQAFSEQLSGHNSPMKISQSQIQSHINSIVRTLKRQVNIRPLRLNYKTTTVTKTTSPNLMSADPSSTRKSSPSQERTLTNVFSVPQQSCFSIRNKNGKRQTPHEIKSEIRQS